MKWALVATLALAAHCGGEARDAVPLPDADPDVSEVPRFGDILGAPEALAILPSAQPHAALELYRQLLESWRSDTHAVEVVSDTEVSAVPADRPVWVLGAANRFAHDLFGPGKVRGLITGLGRIGIEGHAVPSANHSLAVVRRHPDGAGYVGWIVLDPPAAARALAQQLPSLAELSYAAFEGAEAANVLAGAWGEPPTLVPAARAVGARPARPPAREPVDLGALPRLGLERGDGMPLAGAKPGSPAAAAGLKADDVLIRVDGHWVRDVRSYLALLHRLDLGETVTFTVLRAGEELELSAPVGD